MALPIFYIALLCFTMQYLIDVSHMVWVYKRDPKFVWEAYCKFRCLNLITVKLAYSYKSMIYLVQKKQINKNNEVLRETQTLHAGCSKAESNMFAPPQTPVMR